MSRYIPETPKQRNARMLWNCEALGCFNIKMRPKIEAFADCFPGNIAMTDVDGVVEINGHFLFYEHKSGKLALPTGQRIMLQRLTAISRKIAALIIFGNAESMTIRKYCFAHEGKLSDWDDMSLPQLQQCIRDWAAWAQRNGGVYG